MLATELELASIEANDRVDTFSRGYITIRGKYGIATSKEKKPDQSMMLLLSIVQLLDSIRSFIQDSKADKYNYVGVDCSFQFFIERDGDLLSLLNNRKEEIDRVRPIELIEAIWKGVNNFMSCYGQCIDSADLVTDDLYSSIKEFKEQFNLND
jgi:predicted secreted protein